MFLLLELNYYFALGRGPNLLSGSPDPAAVASLKSQCHAGNFNFDGQNPSTVVDVCAYFHD